MPELAAQVDVGGIGPDGIGSNGHAFQELEGVAFHDLAVLEGAGLGLVRVGDHVVRPDVVGNEATT